ncbi:hypothetical protein [Glycomyces sp. NRRL B-16210]|uniref:hypothetical protein n=1 Tax=Glycomyces sp. NRRL B-16210 TaxID=1463821 RepID=UPI000B224327|nr:hypothetical protein [Glycomyces sp. NRRL B-16210]
MTRGILKAMAGAGATVLLLSACSGDGSESNGTDGDSGGGDPVASEMRSWEPCQILGDLQPIVDFMGIKEFTATVSGTDAPDSAGWGESTLDPEALVCGAGIDLGPIDNMPANGTLSVKIVPLEDEAQAEESYGLRVAASEGQGDVETARIDIGDPWDEGVLISSAKESGATDYLNVVARDGQWVLHIDLDYTGDYNALQGNEPDYQFTKEELQQWLIDTYLPEVNATVNDNASEGAAS